MTFIVLICTLSHNVHILGNIIQNFPQKFAVLQVKIFKNWLNFCIIWHIPVIQFKLCLFCGRSKRVQSLWMRWRERQSFICLQVWIRRTRQFWSYVCAMLVLAARAVLVRCMFFCLQVALNNNTLTYNTHLNKPWRLSVKDTLQQCSLLFPGLSDVCPTTEQLTFDPDLT